MQPLCHLARCAAVTSTPDLPPILELSELLAERLGVDGVTPLDGGAYPSTALRVGEHHPVLVRTFHGGDARLSLPHGPYVDLRLLATLDDDLRPVRDALADVATEPELGLADVVVALLRPAVGLDGAGVDWPGVTVPDEVWVGTEAGRVGAFQHPGPRLVVWVGSELHELELPDLASLAELSSWVPPRLDRQQAAQLAAAAELARLEALPLPTVEQLWAHLRAGHEVRLGGGRWEQRYRLVDGVLWETTRDEGDVEEGRVAQPDQRLQAAIDFDPVAIRRLLGQAGA